MVYRYMHRAVCSTIPRYNTIKLASDGYPESCTSGMIMRQSISCPVRTASTHPSPQRLHIQGQMQLTEAERFTPTRLRHKVLIVDSIDSSPYVQSKHSIVSRQGLSAISFRRDDAVIRFQDRKGSTARRNKADGKW